MEAKKLTAGFAVAGAILILIAAGALGQPSVYDVAGTAKLNGNPVTAGTQIVAKDANGTERGNFTVNTTGSYGYLHVNGDATGSIGDVISFFINGVKADQTLIWQSGGNDPNFALTACDLSTYAITVQTDKSIYNPGSGMLVTGYLLNSQCELEPGKTVAYNVPSTAIMGQIQTNGTGYFSENIALPSGMAEGEYSLWASYPPGASETVHDTVNFTVSNDIDGDGHSYSSDCNDTNPSVHPGASDICDNGIDENCNPSDDSCALVVTATSGGGGGGGISCVSNWSCTDFSVCQPSGTQARACADLNKCAIPMNKPAETQNCTYISSAPVTEQACAEGSRKCEGSDLMECSSEGQWVKIQACEFGCSGNACLGQPAESQPPEEAAGIPTAGLFLLEPSSWPFWVAIIIIVAIIIWYLAKKGRKKKGTLELPFE